MKKTLVALAALAATGAFAQVTITGEYAYGYLSTTAAGGVAGVNASGLGVDTADLYIGAKEDLGGGMSVAASMTFSGGSRNASVDTGDTNLALTTSAGVITLASAKGADYLSGGLAGAGTWYKFDGKVFSARTSRDSISYSLPLGALTASFSHQEPANELGEGTGQVGSPAAATGSRFNMYALSYASGALSGNIQYFDYLEKGNTDATTKAATRAAVAYDFGVARLGAGVVVANQAGTGKVTDTLVSVKAPVGSNLTLAAMWGARAVDSSTNALTPNGTKTGSTLQATYNLSKRTYVMGQYMRWDAAPVVAETSTLTALTIAHDF